MSGLRFRVLTFNTLFRPAARERLAAVGPILNSSDIDVICLQEVVYRANATLLQRSLPSYAFHATRRFGIWCVGGLITFARVPIVETSFEVFQQRGEWMSIGAADRLLRKGFLTTRMRLGQVDVVVINTHLLANYDQDWSPSNRYARHEESELEQLTRAVKAIDTAALVVVCGDFNVPADSAMFTRFLTAAGLASAAGAASQPTLRLANAHPGSLAIDHVLFRMPRDWRATSSIELMLAEPLQLSAARRGFASDHIAVCATFTVE